MLKLLFHGILPLHSKKVKHTVQWHCQEVASGAMATLIHSLPPNLTSGEGRLSHVNSKGALLVAPVVKKK